LAHGWRIVIVFAALLGFFAAASGARATTFVVTPALKDGSSTPCSEPCSLRQAITEANKSPEAENLVEVPPGTYELTQGTVTVDPQLKTTETILGRGARANEVVIVGNGASNVLSVGAVGAGAGETVLARAELTGGNSRTSGGGIRVEPKAKLSLIGASIHANSALVSGGGVFVEAGGELDVADSVIAGNSATRGGGLYGGPITVANSTIAANKATREGGGVYNTAGLKLVSATIAGNEAGEGGGGGVAGNAVTAIDSILAKNGPNDCGTTVEDAPLGHNLADDLTCNLSAPGDKQTGPGGAGLVEEKGLPLPGDNGGPTETVALQSTSPAVGAGNQEVCLPTDQREVERPKGLCDIGAFQFSTKPTSSGGGQQASSSPTTTGGGPPPPPPPSPLPPPILARTGDVAPVSGTVFVKLPGTDKFVALSSLREVPFGTLIDATHGRVVVTTAGPHGATQTGEFFEGEFVLTQGRNGVVTATLAGGDFAVCPTARERSHTARAHAAHASGSHVVRKLWANAHGSFSTKGNYAAGAVAGTEWLTEDLCDGTLIRVTRDKVLVTNLVNHHHAILKAGHSQLAKAP
jgi:hypothetical protein